jgi:hypothetical protein
LEIGFRSGRIREFDGGPDSSGSAHELGCKRMLLLRDCLDRQTFDCDHSALLIAKFLADDELLFRRLPCLFVVACRRRRICKREERLCAPVPASECLMNTEGLLRERASSGNDAPMTCQVVSAAWLLSTR